MRRAAARIAPFKTAGTVIPQVKAWIESAAINGDIDGIAGPLALIGLHFRLLSRRLARFFPPTLRFSISHSELAAMRTMAGVHADDFVQFVEEARGRERSDSQVGRHRRTI